MHERAAEFASLADEAYGIDVDVHEFPEGTKTAADAASVVGCDVAQIASSIVLNAGDDLVVVVTSGANHVDTDRLAALREVPTDDVAMADPGAVKAVIGWAIGGVPPFCHDSSVPTYLDETLTGFETVWAAAGTPEAVFPIDPDRLRDCADAEVVAIAE
jgi:prolyl-tRNA editing enzyme YbaK/EbsC (Cys-tRNA(Pro) deacylase)